jgi:HSP20 family protein
MDEVLKDELLLEIDGVEDWMTQFVIDPFFDGNADGIRMDLFETESSYIIEAVVLGYCKEDMKIEVAKDGIHILFNKNGKKANRFVTLPYALCKKRINASFENNILEIIIQKKGKRKKKPFRFIKIK